MKLIKTIFPFLITFFFTGLAFGQSSPNDLPDVKYHLTGYPWKPLNISRNSYLDKIEGVVRQTAQFQDASGAIIDPYEKTEIQYSTPYFAHAVGTLISAGRASDILPAGVAAMNKATADFSTGTSSSTFTHGEFYIAPLTEAIALYQPYVSASVVNTWKSRMQTPISKILWGNTNNWRTYAMKGEWYRAKRGLVNKADAIKWIEDSWINNQRSRFTQSSWNFYHDYTSDPDTWPYEAAARSNLLAMIQDGYDGPSKNEILTYLRKGTQSSLLIQDPTGQGAAGGRSGNHTWNDIVASNAFLIAAEIEKNNGNSELSSQYRHAAIRGFESAQRFLRPDGTYSVTKNQFDPAQRIRYARYSFLTNYNGYMMYHMAENYLHQVSQISELPSPAEVGGYTLLTDNDFASVFANAGGMQMQADLRGSLSPTYNDVYWTMLGVVRFSKVGWDSRLGPSDGTRETSSGLGISFAPTFLENGNWVRLSSMPDRYEAVFTTQFTHPLLVRCQIEYRPKAGKTGPVFTNRFIITPDGIVSKLTSTSANFGMTWPILTYDGKINLNTEYTPYIASTKFPSGNDQQNFIAIHSSPTIVTNIAIKRSSYGDLNPVRMVSGSPENVTFIYPKTAADPPAESVRQSYNSSADNFSTVLGKISGDTYVGRYAAGGMDKEIDLDNDNKSDITFSTYCGFIIQLDNGAITKIEADRNVTAKIGTQSIDLQAYTPYTYSGLIQTKVDEVIASDNDGNGNVAMNTIDGNLSTRWSASGSQWIRFHLDDPVLVRSVNVAWYKGDERIYPIEIQASNDGNKWGTVFTGKSSANTLALENYDIRDTTASYFRFVLNGNNINNWNAITEVEFLKQSQVFNTTGAAITFTRTEDSIDIDQGGVKDFLEYISTSDNVPVSAWLTAAEGSGGVPTWLSVNGKALNGLPYTTGSEITFTADATNLSLGTYMTTVTASAPGYESGQLMITLTVKSGSGGMLTNMKVNFQDSISVPPPGWYKDFGQSFGQRLSSYQGSAQVYGWIRRSDKTPVNLTKNGRKRSNPSSDLLLATLMHMQAGDAPSSSLTDDEGLWEAQVTNGDYDITVSVGDGSYTNSVHALNIEGVKAISDFVPTASQLFKSATVTVSVADGLLTIDAIGGKNTKINYIIIKPSASKRPSVVLVNPENGSQNVSENTSISTSVLNLPNGGINNATLTSSNVYLTEENNGAVIPANVNGTGGGDAITLVPSSPLKLSTTYNFTITSGVKDLSGASFIPYVSQFKTGSGSSVSVSDIKFEKVALANTQGRHSSLTIGPDGKLYALSIDGLIKRFTIKQDGTLGAPELLYSLQDAYGSRQQRLAIGFAFDPASTAGDLIAWITHSSFIFLNGPSWDGRLTKLSGPNLQNVQDVLINLPRSSKDHVTNSVVFGPDKKLYIVQGSTSAMGRADNTWGNRHETLMSGAMLCLDPAKLGSLPLNVKTSDGGGTYNPYASNAPLTIYASGLRNAYDVLWHSNGKLYVPTNGSAAGGNTPSSVQGTIRPDGSPYNGPAISGLTNVQQSQKDFLFRVEKGGYYGHPNPLRGEYVMNGGNPTTSIDPAQVNDYPVGTLPDANWRSYSFDFQTNKSPDGVIEYKSNSFNGALKGKILVVRYSQNDDIIVLTPGGASKDIVSATEGSYIEGFSGFVDPLDLTEDVTKGNIYVSEYGGDGQITLLRPKYDSLPGTAISLNAMADAMIRDGAYASKNYGDDTSLLVKSSPNGGFSRESYLKFSLSGVPEVGKAKLRVYGSNISNSSGVTVGCHGLDNDSWTEQTLTWNTAPASLATVLGSSLVTNQVQYYEFDVTNYVRSQLNGDKVVSLVLKDVNNADKILQFNSKENPQNRPHLIIITDSVGGSTGVTTFNTLADASVRDGSYSSKNYGSDGTLLVKGSPNAGFTRHTYLRFGLTGLTTVGTAKVRIYGSNTSGSKAVTVTGYGVDNDTWSENSITWTTAPPAQSTAQGEVAVTNQKQYYEIDVTGYVKSQLSGDKVVSLLLKDAGNADNILEFNSKENGQYPPQLVVTDGSQTLTTYSQNTAPTEAYQDTTSRSGAYSMEETEISKHDFEKPRVYPNPLHSKFNLEFPASYLGNYNVQILDGNGRLYLSENVRIRPGGFNLMLNISQLKLIQGIYFLKVSNDKGTKDSFKLFVY